MLGERRLGLAVAQVGGIDPSESRELVVGRLVELMREAKSRGASVVVYPELTLTTFFPRMVTAYAPWQVFAFFTGMMLLQLLWVLTMVRETKNVPLEQMRVRMNANG